MIGELPSMNCRQNIFCNIANLESAISPSSELQFGNFFFFEFGYIFARNLDLVLDFVIFSPKFSDLIFKLAAQKIHGVCWRLLPKIETKICFKPSFPWIHNLKLIPLIWILMGGTQDLKIWNGSDKIYKIRMP